MPELAQKRKIDYEKRNYKEPKIIENSQRENPLLQIRKIFPKKFAERFYICPENEANTLIKKIKEITYGRTITALIYTSIFSRVEKKEKKEPEERLKDLTSTLRKQIYGDLETINNSIGFEFRNKDDRLEEKLTKETLTFGQIKHFENYFAEAPRRIKKFNDIYNFWKKIKKDLPWLFLNEKECKLTNKIFSKKESTQKKLKKLLISQYPEAGTSGYFHYYQAQGILNCFPEIIKQVSKEKIEKIEKYKNRNN